MSNEQVIEKLSQLQNILSRKETYHFNINGKISQDGILRQPLNRIYNLNQDFDYLVSLTHISYSAFFYNVDDTCNKFYFSMNSNDHNLTIPKGLYEVDNYNKVVEEKLCRLYKSQDLPIKITINKSTGLSKIFIRNSSSHNYKVDFTKDKTWRSVLGFNPKIIKESINLSDRMVNLTSSIECFIGYSLNENSGINSNCRDTNIIYKLFLNHYFGEFVNKNNKGMWKNFVLSNKHFNYIDLYFRDNNGKPLICG